MWSMNSTINLSYMLYARMVMLIWMIHRKYLISSWDIHLCLKLKFSQKFRNSVVLKYSSDSYLIKTIADLLPNAEVLFYDPYLSTHWDTHILYLCSLSVPIYMIQASCKTHIPLPDSNDSPCYEIVSAKYDVPIHWDIFRLHQWQLWMQLINCSMFYPAIPICNSRSWSASQSPHYTN